MLNFTYNNKSHRACHFHSMVKIVRCGICNFCSTNNGRSWGIPAMIILSAFVFLLLSYFFKKKIQMFLSRDTAPPVAIHCCSKQIKIIKMQNQMRVYMKCIWDRLDVPKRFLLIAKFIDKLKKIDDCKRAS